MFVFAAEILLLLVRIDLFESIAVLYPIVFHLISMQEETHHQRKVAPTAFNIIAVLAWLAMLGPAGHSGNNYS
jgi:hypothetical protein